MTELEQLKEDVKSVQKGLNNMSEELEKLRKIFLEHKHQTKGPKLS